MIAEEYIKNKNRGNHLYQRLLNPHLYPENY